MSDSLAIDIYEGDGDYNLDALGAAGRPWVMAMLKVSQGTYYSGGSWLNQMWPRAASCWGSRLGVDGFRVGYHYLDIANDGSEQCDYFLEQISAAGGLGPGDPFVVMDLERGGQRRPFSRTQIIMCAASFVERVQRQTGLTCVCYGGEYLRDNGIRLDDIGCTYGWVADYDATLPSSTYRSIGCYIDDLMGWQYCGVESATNIDVHLKGYPWTTPAGPADISALCGVGGGGDGALQVLEEWCSAAGR